MDKFVVRSIGTVRSKLKTRDDAPRQGNEGAPDAWLEIDETFVPALDGIEAGSEIIVITWFDRSERNVLAVHPRNDETLPLSGVFATRSPDRPNPLGLHRVLVKEILGSRLLVGPIEALDHTPIVDIKPVLSGSSDF